MPSKVIYTTGQTRREYPSDGFVSIVQQALQLPVTGVWGTRESTALRRYFMENRPAYERIRAWFRNDPMPLLDMELMGKEFGAVTALFAASLVEGRRTGSPVSVFDINVIDTGNIAWVDLTPGPAQNAPAPIQPVIQPAIQPATPTQPATRTTTQEPVRALVQPVVRPAVTDVIKTPDRQTEEPIKSYTDNGIQKYNDPDTSNITNTSTIPGSPISSIPAANPVNTVNPWIYVALGVVGIGAVGAVAYAVTRKDKVAVSPKPSLARASDIREYAPPSFREWTNEPIGYTRGSRG